MTEFRDLSADSKDEAAALEDCACAEEPEAAEDTAAEGAAEGWEAG